MNAVYARVLGWLQKRCEHDHEYVKADILEGLSRDVCVSWCEVCGAYEVHWKFGGTHRTREMRRPDPEVKQSSTLRVLDWAIGFLTLTLSILSLLFGVALLGAAIAP